MNRTLGFIALLGVSCTALAQEPPAGTVTFNHVALSVSDADRSVTFYSRIFGLEEIVNRTEVEGIRWVSLGEGKELHLISVVKEPVTLNKAVHFALTTSDFDGFVAILQEDGVAYSDWPGNAGKITVRADDTRQIYIQDPDGYWIEVNSVASD